ncbi:actin-binding Rho-activating protein-like [Culicoides brevitarsis]|uniref:actin-binding Rho-activating protein-like n=1 Tax=Culicoides brevitarsis TaxID=469753 RepID=UPI00307C69FE
MSDNYGSNVPYRIQKIDVSRCTKFLGPQTTEYSTETLKRRNEYGKPKSGSLTEMRGQKASIHVFQDMLQLCEIIDIEGQIYNGANHKMILFGDLFHLYATVNDKLVGILLRARKHGYVQFEGEMLYQRRDDDVPVFLTNTLENITMDIRKKQNEISMKIIENPVATTLL